MTLDGLEAVAVTAAPKGQKVHVVKYADDFIITGASKELLEEKVKPAVAAFLRNVAWNSPWRKPGSRISRWVLTSSVLTYASTTASCSSNPPRVR